jgi:hypothetical protein
MYRRPINILNRENGEITRGSILEYIEAIRGRYLSVSSRLMKKGSPEGVPILMGLPLLRGAPLLRGLPLAGVWGCPPDLGVSPGIIFPPSSVGRLFLARKGKAAHLGRTGIGRKGFSAPRKGKGGGYLYVWEAGKACFPILTLVGR